MAKENFLEIAVNVLFKKGMGLVTILKDLKILDFSLMLPGVFTTMMFADFGADVIHVESTRRVDLMRIMPPYDENKESYIHQHLNRSKKSIKLNLKTEEAVEIVKKLIQEYDIVVEGFRPGVMERLGLDYESLKKSIQGSSIVPSRDMDKPVRTGTAPGMITTIYPLQAFWIILVRKERSRFPWAFRLPTSPEGHCMRQSESLLVHCIGKKRGKANILISR